MQDIIRKTDEPRLHVIRTLNRNTIISAISVITTIRPLAVPWRSSLWKTPLFTVEVLTTRHEESESTEVVKTLEIIMLYTKSGSRARVSMTKTALVLAEASSLAGTTVCFIKLTYIV